MALRLARYFGTTAEFWINLQAFYDLSISRRPAEEKINRDVRQMVKVKQGRVLAKGKRQLGWRTPWKNRRRVLRPSRIGR
jgi:hypothetical protein